VTGTGHARWSRGRLLAAAACPAALACLLASCGSPQSAASGTGPAGDAVASPAAVRSEPGTATPAPQPTAAAKPLAGVTVGIDPGHNGLNGTDPAYINHLIWNGRENETCDTTGTQTASGYTEARYNFNVARYLRAALLADGAHVVMTRQDNHGVGPCVDRRAQILNRSGAQVAIDIHADGGPAWGRGFTVLEPVADGPNDQVIVDFATATKAYHDALVMEGHFVIVCDHDMGHTVPASGVASGWQFLLDHPFGVTPEPYAKGLPKSFPSYCVL